MPTLAGLRRRGVPPEAIRDFVRRIGMSKANSVVDLAMFDHAIRDRLNQAAQRRMAVLRPLKLVIENFPEDHVEELEAVNHPADPGAGTRTLRFSREIFIERDDFMENPPNKFFRMAVGREVRLRYAFLVTCRQVVKDADGNVVELRCTYDPASRGGNAPDGRKVKATLHWVSGRDARPAEVRLYSTLFNRPDPGADGDLDADLNPGSLEVLSGALLEPSLAEMPVGEAVQFERLGYFCPDPRAARTPWCSTARSSCATPGQSCRSVGDSSCNGTGYVLGWFNGGHRGKTNRGEPAGDEGAGRSGAGGQRLAGHDTGTHQHICRSKRRPSMDSCRCRALQDGHAGWEDHRHGNLTLAVIATFSRDVLKIDNVRNGINYGSNKVRFTSPVQVGARIRGRQKLLAADDMPNGGIRMTYQWTVEIEGKERPACVAETMSIAYAKT